MCEINRIKILEPNQSKLALDFIKRQLTMKI